MADERLEINSSDFTCCFSTNMVHRAVGREMDDVNDDRRLLWVKSNTLYLIVVTTHIPVFALGISIRFGLHLHPDSQGLYIVEYLFVVLSVSASQ